MEKEDLVKDDSYIAFNPECVRKRANWSKSDKHYKFDTLNFNPAEFLADIQNNSPKLNSLLEKNSGTGSNRYETRWSFL